MNNKFDIIIYGASVSGCLLAIEKSKRGKKVLLINNYGFPGGAVTESLASYQRVDHLKSESVNKLLNKIRKNKFGTLSEIDNKVIINPEVIKYQLQLFLQESDIKSLFHARAIKIGKGNDKKYLTLSMREGLKKIEFDELIDTTDNYDFYCSLNTNSTEVLGTSINCIITKPGNDNFNNFQYLNKAIKLNDGRYWISINIEKDFSNENYIQKVLTEYSNFLRSSQSRIQLTPTNYFYDLDVPKNNDKNFIKIKNDITNHNFDSTELLVEADKILGALNN